MNAVLQAIKHLLTSRNIPVFGMAASSVMEGEPPGYRPSDLLPSARSILCLGTPVPRGILKCREKANENYWRAANIYYRHIDAILMEASRLMEEGGETALPVFG